MSLYLDYNGLQKYCQLFEEYLNWGPTISIANGVIDLKVAKRFIINPSQDIQLSFMNSPRNTIHDIWIQIYHGGKYTVDWPDNVLWGYKQKEPELVEFGYNLIKLSTMDNGATWIAKNIIAKNFFSDEWPEISTNTSFDLSTSTQFYFDATGFSGNVVVSFNGTAKDEYFWIRVKDGENKIIWPDNVEWENDIQPFLDSEKECAILFIKSLDGTKWIGKLQYRFLNKIMSFNNNTSSPYAQAGNRGYEYGLDVYFGYNPGESSGGYQYGCFLERTQPNVEANKTYTVGIVDGSTISEGSDRWQIWGDETVYTLTSNDGIFFWVEYKDENDETVIYSTSGNVVSQCWNSEYESWYLPIGELMNVAPESSDMEISDINTNPFGKYIPIDYDTLNEKIGSSLTYYVNYEVQLRSNKTSKYILHPNKNMYFKLIHNQNHKMLVTFYWRCIEYA